MLIRNVSSFECQLKMFHHSNVNSKCFINRIMLFLFLQLNNVEFRFLIIRMSIWNFLSFKCRFEFLPHQNVVLIFHWYSVLKCLIFINRMSFYHSSELNVDYRFFIKCHFQISWRLENVFFLKTLIFHLLNTYFEVFENFLFVV